MHLWEGQWRVAKDWGILMPGVSRLMVQGISAWRATSRSGHKLVEADPPLGNVSAGLDSYITAVNRVPMLTARDEILLSRKVHKEEDSDAAKLLIKSNLRFVIPIARSYLGYRQSLDDLIQEGNMGLIKAIHRFQPTTGSRLVHLATPFITAAIRDCIVRLWHMVPSELTRTEQELFFRLPETLREGWPEVTGTELRKLATSLRTRPEVLRRLQIWLAGTAFSLDRQEWRHRHHHRQSQLPSGDGIGTEASEELEHQFEAMHQFLDHLAPRARDILMGRWLTPGPRPKLHEFALRYGISRERVRQIEQEAFNSIRNGMRSHWRRSG